MTTLLHIFLVWWSWFSHQTCQAYTAPVGHLGGQLFFGGSCTDAVTYAKDVGGSAVQITAGGGQQVWP